VHRYLVFAPNCLDSLARALEVCNREGAWIDEAMDVRDLRVGALLRGTDHQVLAGPAIIRVEKGRVRVVQGQMFLRRLQQVLGQIRTAELMQVLQLRADIPASESARYARESGDCSGKREHGAVPQASGAINRRKFLGLG